MKKNRQAPMKKLIAHQRPLAPLVDLAVDLLVQNRCEKSCVIGWTRRRRNDSEIIRWTWSARPIWLHIQCGRPMQNGDVGSFDGWRRKECLETHWLRTVKDAQSAAPSWREGELCERRIVRCYRGSKDSRKGGRHYLDTTVGQADLGKQIWENCFELARP